MNLNRPMPVHHHSYMNAVAPMNYGIPRPSFPNQSPEMFHQPLFNHGTPMYQPRMHPRANFIPRRPSFLPQRPPVQPHVNPNFIPQNGPMQFIPEHDGMSHMAPGMIPDNIAMPVDIEFVPTPPTRLSPRSAQ